MDLHSLEPQESTENKWKSPPMHRATISGGSGREETVVTGERPSKIRKQQHPPDGHSMTALIAEQKKNSLNADYYVDLYGFLPSDFLPLKPETQRRSDASLFQTLCPDSLGKCLFGGYLKTEEMVRLALVSKGFQALARDHIQHLDLSRLPCLTPRNLRRIIARYPHLTDLNFDYCPQFGDEHLQELYPLVSLEQLSLRGSRVSGGAVSALLKTLASKSLSGKVTSLAVLDLSATSSEQSMNIGDDVVNAITIFCPELQVLRLEWCKAITDESLESLVCSVPKCLHQLSLPLTSISNQGLSALRRLIDYCPISTLDVSASYIQADAFLASLAGIHAHVALVDLKLEFLPDLSVQQMVQFFASPVSSRLTSFQVSHCSPSTPETTLEYVRQLIQTTLAKNRTESLTAGYTTSNPGGARTF